MYALHAQNTEILLVTTPDVAERNPAFTPFVSETFLVNTDTSSRKEVVRTIWKKLKSAQIELAVLNTAQGKMMRDLCLKALFHPIEFVGIIHTTRMFTESFTQKIIHKKVKKYLLLSQFLKDKVNPPRRIRVDYFYPLRFPTNNQWIEKRHKVVAIIGGVEERRKDLKGFVRMLSELKDKNIRFVFIGKSDPEKAEVKQFLKALDEQSLGELVTTFDHFVAQEKFDSLVQNADFILPLVHPDTPSADQYFKNQISGAMTVSFGYKVPMLIHEAYSHIEEMQAASFYYHPETFAETLQTAIEGAAEKQTEMNAYSSYQADEQERRYILFLES